MVHRIIFKRHLTGLFIGDSLARFLSKQGVLLKDLSAYVAKTTDELKAEVKNMAQQATA